MKPNQDQTPAARALAADVVAHAVVRVPLEAIADLRRQPSPSGSPTLPANFLKHADEQTVAGLAAVFQAIQQSSLPPQDYTRWGVLGSPRFPGRLSMISSVKRFVAEGAWGVSPHMVPHRSLHSLSGALSQALKIHGPNFGVGGGNSGADEIVFASLALLERMKLPGVWMVITAQDPEADLDDEGQSVTNRTVRALALALTPPQSTWRGLRLGLQLEPASTAAVRPDYFKLFRMVEQLGEREPGMSVTQPLQHCARLTLSWAREAAVVLSHPAHAKPRVGRYESLRALFVRSSAEVPR